MEMNHEGRGQGRPTLVPGPWSLVPGPWSPIPDPWPLNGPGDGA